MGVATQAYITHCGGVGYLRSRADDLAFRIENRKWPPVHDEQTTRCYRFCEIVMTGDKRLGDSVRVGVHILLTDTFCRYFLPSWHTQTRQRVYTFPAVWLHRLTDTSDHSVY